MVEYNMAELIKSVDDRFLYYLKRLINEEIKRRIDAEDFTYNKDNAQQYKGFKGEETK